MRSRRWKGASLAATVPALAVAIAGCGEETSAAASAGEPSDCLLGVVGDPTRDIEMQLVGRAPDGTIHDLADGGDLALTLPPQGGRVVFVGARATNLVPCSVQLDGALRDPVSGGERVEDRVVDLRPDGSGFGGPAGDNIATFSNLTACPNTWASTALNDNPFEITLTITDRDGRSASSTISVVPRCSEPALAADCSCMCQVGYMLGDPCP